LSRIETPIGIVLRWLVALLALVATGTSGYLLWLWSGGSGPVVGCDPGAGFDCEHVLNSRWSTLMGVVPVSLPAVLVYFGMFVCSLVVGMGISPAARRRAWLGLLLVATLAATASVWFVGLQLFSVGHICIYCMTVHACGLVAAATIFYLAPLTLEPPPVHHTTFRMRASAGASVAEMDDEPEHFVIRLGTSAPPVITGLASVVALVAVQYFYQPQTYTVQKIVITEPTEVDYGKTLDDVPLRVVSPCDEGSFGD
jgi:uncharacterized membrane protein